MTNGTLQIDNRQFHPSHPSRPIREALPVKYDPKATCDNFRNAFLAHILDPHHIDLLQRYCSQILEGLNHNAVVAVQAVPGQWSCA